MSYLGASVIALVTIDSFGLHLECTSQSKSSSTVQMAPQNYGSAEMKPNIDRF